MKYYVYRFLNENNEIVYVGQTVDIKSRMNQHFSSSGHLPKECYDSVKTIEYIELSSKTEMNIYEIYYINKWTPIYNTKDKNNENFGLKLAEPIWKVYTSKEEKSYIEKLEKDIFILKNRCEELERSNELLTSYNNELIEKQPISREVINENRIMELSVDDIIRIYEYSKSEKIKFTCTVHHNNKLIGNYTIYYKDGKVLLNDTQQSSDNVDSVLYILKTKEKPLSLNFGKYVTYIPNSNIAYRILAKLLKEDATKMMKGYNFECNSKELIQLNKNGWFVDIVTGDEICILNNNVFLQNKKSEDYNKYEAKDIGLTNEVFLLQYKDSLFKNLDYKRILTQTEQTLSKAKECELATIYNEDIQNIA